MNLDIRRISRRSVLVRLGAGASLAALLAACGGSSSSTSVSATPVPSAQPTAATAASPSAEAPTAQAAASTVVPTAAATAPGAAQKMAPQVRIGLNSDINTLDPHMTATVGTDLSVISHIYNRLVTRGTDLKIVGEVAESWKATSDTSWQFKLRSGIKFENGEVLDASAVKWNIDRVLNPDTKARVAPWFALVKSANVVDNATLEIVTSQPYPALVAQLTEFFLLAPKWTQSHDPAKEAMGSGGYTLKEWVKDDHVTLIAKSDYWGTKPPYQTVTFRPIPENSSRTSGLLAGDIDVAVGISPSDFKQINGSGRATAGAVPSSRTAMIKFNTLTKPFDDRRIRQALNYAVDKEGIIKALLNGMTTPSQGQVLTDAYFGFNPDLKPYPYDVAQAKKLMSDAGVTSPITAELDVPTGTYLLGQEITQAIAGQLQQVGVQAKLTEMPFSVYMDKYLKQQAMAPMIYITQAWPTLDADGLLTLFEKGNQYAYWADEEFSKDLDEARSTMDEAKRLNLYKQATARMRDEAPVIFLFPQPATYATAKTIQWKARPDDWVSVWEMKPLG
ncbi:MAG TPA: ABC transporter substrate-binding protein [Chloroflexota bacterium]|nr:ABC transporter substrate-binding protein [Chloroflexota bacterium]